MLKGGKDIDAVFKNGLSDYEVAPEEYVWDSLEKSLASQRKQQRTLLLWRSLAAACIAGFIMLTVGLLYNVSESSVETVVQLPENNRLQTDVTEAEAPVAKVEPMVAQQKDVGGAIIADKPIENTEMSTAVAEPALTETSQFEMAYLASNSSPIVQGEYEVDQNLRVKTENVYFPLYNYNTESSSKKKKTSISVGGVVSPSYNSKVSYGVATKNAINGSANADEKGINSLGGGLQVRVNTGSRWSFETGVMYSQVGQSVNNIQSTRAFSDFQTVRQQSGTVIANSMGDVVVKGTNTEFMSAPAMAASRNEAPVLNYSSGYNSIKQTLDYIEVPVMARYSLFKNFPYLSLAGGFSSNFLVDNSAYAVDGRSKEKIGETSDIKSFVISSSVGLGVDVPITQTIRLNVEPRFKYFLNSVSSNEYTSFQPYTFGVYGGLTFVLK